MPRNKKKRRRLIGILYAVDISEVPDNSLVLHFRINGKPVMYGSMTFWVTGTIYISDIVQLAYDPQQGIITSIHDDCKIYFNSHRSDRQKLVEVVGKGQTKARYFSKNPRQVLSAAMRNRFTGFGNIILSKNLQPTTEAPDFTAPGFKVFPLELFHDSLTVVTMNPRTTMLEAARVLKQAMIEERFEDAAAQRDRLKKLCHDCARSSGMRLCMNYAAVINSPTMQSA